MFNSEAQIYIATHELTLLQSCPVDRGEEGMSLHPWEGQSGGGGGQELAHQVPQ